MTLERYSGFEMRFFDLETTDLKAFMGRVLAGVIVDQFGEPQVFRLDETKRTSAIDDTELCLAIRNSLEEADILIGWNSKLFDIPFLNARLMQAGEKPMRKDIMHIDLMYYAKGQFMRIGSAKLDNVQKFFGTETGKTVIDWDTWALAATGDPKALDEVVQHCQNDVYALAEVFDELKPNVRLVHR